MKPLAALFARLAKRPKNTYIFTGACPQNRGIRKKRIPKAGPVVHSCHEPAKTFKGVPGESMQRFVRPVLFCLLVLAIFMCAFYTQRGTSFVNPFMLGRYADFAANSPLLSTVLLVVSLPAGILVFLLPESQAITLAVSDLGFALGLIVSVFALAAASGTACTLTRAFLQSSIHRWVAARRQAGKSLPRRAVLPLEYCLFLTVLLLVLNVPVALVGLVLGMCGMRTKAFCVAAVPILFARAAMAGLATVEAGFFTLTLLILLGTVLAAGYLYWVAILFKKRRQHDMHEGIMALVDSSEQLRQASKGADALDALRLDDLPHDAPRAAQTRDSLAMGGTSILVCVRDEETPDDAAALVADAARSLEMRVITCSMCLSDGNRPQGSPLSLERDTTPLGGFRDVTRVADLDELFTRAFQEGASQVLAVRPVTAYLRREALAEALEALPSAGLVLAPLAGPDRQYCLVGLARSLGRARYTQGALAHCTFASDISFALTGFANRPHMLRPLPQESETRPLVSVVVVAGERSTTLANTIYSALKAPWTECVAALLPEAGEMAEDAGRTGARVVRIEKMSDLNSVVASLAGTYVLFVADCVLLPDDFDEGVLSTMGQERAVLGAFSLPASVPALQRTLRWIGSAVKPGHGAGPSLGQGIFLKRDFFAHLGGFEDAPVAEAVAHLVSHAALEGRIIVHNRRVRALENAAREEQEKKGLLAQAREGVDNIFGKKVQGEQGEPEAREDAGPARLELGRQDLRAQAAAMVENCDHCGRCTHFSPMLHKHGMDLSDLPSKPLLAWHCFMCGACTAVCDKGIDGVSLVRLLRKNHVQTHGNRLARPGHGKTLSLARLVSVFAKSARPGQNLLLDADFCCVYPKTALKLARFMHENGRGVILAESGACLADLGMENAAHKKVATLRKVMEEKEVTGLYAISPVTQAWLISRGIAVEPVYVALRELLHQPMSLAPYHVMIPCADRGREVFGKSLQPLLTGEYRVIDIPCCGGGGEAAVLEPQLAAALKRAVKSVLRNGERVLSYSTHCAESLSRAGVPTDHALSALFGLRERPRAGLAQVSSLVKTLVSVAGLGQEKAREAEGTGDGQEGAKNEGRVSRLFGKLRRKEESAAHSAAAPLVIDMDGPSASEPAPEVSSSVEKTTVQESVLESQEPVTNAPVMEAREEQESLPEVQDTAARAEAAERLADSEKQGEVSANRQEPVSESVSEPVTAQMAEQVVEPVAELVAEKPEAEALAAPNNGMGLDLAPEAAKEDASLQEDAPAAGIGQTDNLARAAELRPRRRVARPRSAVSLKKFRS